jgi:Tfp pilus assembly protein PilE
MKRWKIVIIAGIIAGILVAMAIPLYTGHVERARVTEATSIMGTIITSQKVYFTRRAQYYIADNSVDPKAFEPYGIDITDTKFFTYKTAPTPDDGFIVTATATDAYGAGGGSIIYVYDPVRGGRWTSEPSIPDDMYEPGPPSHSPRILII